MELDLSDINAEMISARLTDERISWSKRNRLIKKALSKVFGYKNVRVKQEYSWVHIIIMANRPHKGKCRSQPFDYTYCRECSTTKDSIVSMVWHVLKETGLYSELTFYYTDMGEKREECHIDVRFIDEAV